VERPARKTRPKLFMNDNEGASDEVDGGEIFENCIEKNFHVSLIYESGQLKHNLIQLVQFCVVEN